MGILLLLLIIVVGVYKIQPYYANAIYVSGLNPPFNDNNKKDSNPIDKDIMDTNDMNKPYYVKSGYKIKGYFDTIEVAIDYGEEYKRSAVIDAKNEEWIWNNYEPFIIMTDYGVQDFNKLESAVYYAKRNFHDKIYWKGNTDVIWDLNRSIPEEVILDIPVIKQYPELPRGCEVTSLAMVLQYMDVDVDKLELAQAVKKDTTKYFKDTDGKIIFGNPYDGFVGDMYNIKNNGYGVYHGPITELAELYMPNQVIDFTGVDFEILLHLVSEDMPVWIVANSIYKPLPEEMFEMWHTPTGIVKITYREHAVVITGYSDNYVYINDPLKSKQNIKVNKKEFIDAWVQMGSQAVAIYKDLS